MAQRGEGQFSLHPKSITAKASGQSITPVMLSYTGLMKDRMKKIFQGLSLCQLLPPLLFSSCISLGASSSLPGMEYDYRLHPKMVCIPIKADADPGCFSRHRANDHGHHGLGGGGSPSGYGWRGLTDEAKTTILHLRETLVQQKETILDLQETIRELTAKLTLCEGYGRGVGSRNDRHSQHHPNPPTRHHPYPDASRHSDPHYPLVGHRSDPRHSGPSSPEQVGRMLKALKERLENLQSRNTSSPYSDSLRDLLHRKINALEQQLHHHPALRGNEDHHDDHDHNHEDDYDRDQDRHGRPFGYGHYENHRDNIDHHYDHRYEDHRDDGHHDSEGDGHDHSPRKTYHNQRRQTANHGLRISKLDSVLGHLHLRSSESGSRKKPKKSGAFQIGFPMRTNYMYGRVRGSLLNEIFALTLCVWIKGGSGPGLGAPFSYSVPGQANELVLIEWGNNPMQLLVNDKAVTLPLSLSDGRWHHLCLTWSIRDGLWEAYQDGVKRGSRENLSTWHPIKPGGVFILGQKQDTLGGRFDATQAFVGEISDLQMWSHVLTSQEIHDLGTCGGHMTGNIITWAESVVELHGGVTKYPFNPCH